VLADAVVAGRDADAPARLLAGIPSSPGVEPVGRGRRVETDAVDT
jgi:hypothetical protein